MGILARYVLIEVLKVFLVALCALTTMMIVIGIVREAAQQNLPLAHIVRLIPYILPDALRFTVPTTLLLACTTVFSRMSGSNEIVAIKALGISPMVVLWPVFIMALGLSLVTVWLNDLAVSWGKSGVQRVVVGAVEDIVYSLLQAQHRYSSPFFAINVKGVEGRRLLRPTVTIKNHGPNRSMTITAQEAELRSDLERDLLIIRLRKPVIDVEGKLNADYREVYELPIPLGAASRVRPSARLPSMLALGSIGPEIAKQRALIERHEKEMAALAVYQMTRGDFTELINGRWPIYREERKDYDIRLHRLETEPHRRWSAGFSCLCFAWVGVPLAVLLRNRDFLTSFFMCFAPILAIYYPLLAYGVDGAKGGTIPPYSVWAGNLVLLVIGSWILQKVLRY